MRTFAETLPVSIAPSLLEGFSLEMTAGDTGALSAALELLPAATRISITSLVAESFEARVMAAEMARSLGFVPVPHLSARRIASVDELTSFLGALRSRANIQDVFVVAGDVPNAAGPFADTLALIRTGLLQDYGVRSVGIAGYPEGHPGITAPVLDQALRDKHRMLVDLGLECSITTQFGFDVAPVLNWLERIRAEGVDVPVRIGVPGPASVKTLLRFAARCGVAASANVMRKYGVSITKLLSTAGPELILRDLETRLDPGLHGRTSLHFYPFGGLSRTAEWTRKYSLQVAQ